MSTRESRRTIAGESPLNPISLIGSYLLYESEEQIRQGLVVAEPQPGVYMVEFYDLVTDEPQCQRVIKIDEFTKIDEDGGTWRFYDSHAEVRAAFRSLIRQ